MYMKVGKIHDQRIADNTGSEADRESHEAVATYMTDAANGVDLCIEVDYKWPDGMICSNKKFNSFVKSDSLELDMLFDLVPCRVRKKGLQKTPYHPAFITLQFYIEESLTLVRKRAGNSSADDVFARRFAEGMSLRTNHGEEDGLEMDEEEDSDDERESW